MLTLDINNKYLALDPSTSIIVKHFNPVCLFDKLAGSAGVNIKLPAKEINRAILGNPEKFDKYRVGESLKFSGAKLRWKGATVISGSLVVNSAIDGYSCWIQSDLGVMGEAQREKNITEMSWPTEQTFVHQASYDDDTDDYGVEMLHNRNFWEGKGKEDTVDISFIDSNGFTRFNDDTRSVLGLQMAENYGSMVNNYTLGDLKDGCVISPFLHLRYVISESLRMNKWFIDRDDFATAAAGPLSFLKNLKIYNNFNIIDFNLTTTAVTVKTWDYNQQDLSIEEADEIVAKSWVMNTFDYADLLPKKSYKKFLLGLQNSLNYIFHFRQDNKVNIIDRNAVLETTPINLQNYFVNEWQIGERKDLTLKFMPEYDKDDEKFGDEFEDLSDRRSDFEEPAETIVALKALPSPKQGELRLVKEFNQIYEYKWKVISQQNEAKLEDQIDALGWEFASSGPQPYLFGTGDEVEEIHSAFSTLQKTVGGVPMAVQQGNINSMRSLWNDYTLRLVPPNHILFPEALYWEGDNGLFVKRWRKFANFWKNRLEVKGDFNMPMNMIVYVISNITNKFRTDDGEFIIESMETEFTLHAIGTTKINAFKV